MHPFGCEAETSLQDLFQYFQGALQRGEWELASACVPQLLSSSGGLSERLKDIIKAVICHPHSLWESVGSPHRLAWFWLQVLEKWTEEKTLQHVFIQHLMRKLERPEKVEVEEWAEDIYAVLALMPWKSGGGGGGQLEALCEALWAARAGPLKEERILSCLIRPRCHSLVSMYCSTAVRLQRDLLLDLPEAEKLSLSLCRHHDRPSAWKTIFFECLSSGKHFLEQVLVTALDLIKHQEFSELQALLQLEFQPLSRLLLLLGWTQSRSLDSARTLLRILAAASDSVLQEFADLLSSQLAVLEWCKNNNGVSTEALLSQLHTLDSHSALYILHSLTPLTHFEERRILELLQQPPSGAELRPAAHRNVRLFQGFCAMKYAVYAVCVSAHRHASCGECVSVLHQLLPDAGMDRNTTSSELELGHFVQGCRGFLVDVTAMEGFLKLLKKALDGINGVGEGPQEAEAASLGCSVTPETFESRRQRLSKRTAEAQWRLQIVTSNQGAGGAELCPCGGPHNWLVPAMLAPPESLLISCIRRGNFMEVSAVLGLGAAACCGELAFMESYKEVLVELGRVEQKMESQSMSSSSSSSEGLGSAAGTGGGRSRLGSSGRSTLQAIGSAAAAVAFYSISDIAERLLSTPAHPLPSLEEGYWLDGCPPDPPGPVYALLEELSPAAMAAFDLACCHCQLWKTSRQLLDTAERRLNASLEARMRVDPKAPRPDGVCGFPVVLQNISKILNHKSSAKASSPFGCCIQEVLLCCHPTLGEENISARLSLTQRLESIVQVLSTAADAAGSVGGALLALLVEQAGLKQSELDAHPVRSNMKQLLRTLDQLCPFEPELGRPDYVRSFLDYVNTLASVLVRCLGSEQTNKVKLGNPMLVLLQAPFQLVSHLLFERQVSPGAQSLLKQEGLCLSVQQVIVQRCCEALPVWTSCSGEGGDSGMDAGPFSVTALSPLLQQHVQDLTSAFGISDPRSDASSESEVSVDDHSTTPSSLSTSPPSQSTFPSSSSFLLTASALSFLKSCSPLLAALSCLSACRGETAKTQSSGWSGYFRSGRKDVVLDGEQLYREADGLLKEFPVLRAYLQTMVEPLLDSSSWEGEGSAGLGALICGKPIVGLLLSGPQDEATQALAAEAFEKALISRDLSRALSLLELYGRGSGQERALRDRLLACSALELFRVQDPDLRARVTLRALEQWPLAACLELMEFCLNDPDTETELRSELELKQKELSVYHQMMSLQPPPPGSTWQELRAESKANPEAVLSILLETKQEFALCEQWAGLHPVSEQLRLQLQTEHLLHLLEKGQADEAFQLLEAVSDSEGLDVCERALDRRPGLAACHFLSDYLTVHFQRQVSPARRRHIEALHLGSKQVLLTLPPAARQDYFPLLSEPMLILEQLLMNLKVDWAEVAVRTLRSLLVGQEAGFGAEDVDKLLADYACKALDFSCAPRERSRSSVISLQDSLLQCPAHEDQPPAEKDWVPDSQQDVCMVCRRERFTMFNRRHHCRRCGRLVCQACSERRMLVEGHPGEEVRVCDQCYSFFHATQPDLDGMLHLPEVVHRRFQLSTNPAENQLLRSGFYYEQLQAPSAHLCVAILSLHSDQTACGRQLIAHCRALSRKLTNPEVDAGLLTDVMRRLLFSAKVMFVKVSRSQDLALCDYISKVDVLKILVTANYKYIPSLDDILETTAVARLRNQLLEAEHYQLAVEQVSTKSGLDPAGVWQAWATASLKAGNLSAAREKFTRCLKAPVDRNQLSLGPPLLQEVVQHLENDLRPSPSTAYGEDVLASLRELEGALRENSSVERHDHTAAASGSLNPECLYYLSAYGTHLALISFYMRHDCVTEAVTYLIKKDCPDEVFLEGVLQPTLERGRLSVLQGVLEKLDPGLDSCVRYLIASCQFLQRRGFYHSLYQLQQFMMQRWLVKAKEHLKAYLQEQQGRGAGRKRSSVISFRKTMSSSDVSRHVNTIELQLEVTRFLHRCESAASSKSTPTGATKPSASPPTLFGGTPMKVEVACKVMLGGKNIEEGFGIAYRVIQDFQLEAQVVYVRAGQRLIRQRQFSSVRQLLKCVGESGSATRSDCDALLLSCVSAAEKAPADAKDLESLVLEIKSSENKIKGYLLCSKLRPAYLLAVKLEPGQAGPLVQEVLQAAEEAQDSVMQNICRQWLSEH
uniref:Zinc finger FYVE domain-containing protein 26 n=1 Tax=Oryzias melastigma TaxID=30732 RepID=A0A3B3CS37_ORYME